MDKANSPSRRATRAVINLGAIRHNARLLQAMAGPDVGVMAVVKANAYGHGASPVARACLEAGAAWLAVAAVDEGVALRRDGITAPVLVLGPSAAEEYPTALMHDLALAVGSPTMAADAARAARALGVTARVHAKVDTGLNRFGIPSARAVDEITAIAALPNLALEGVYTHLAASEETDKSSARAQLSLFGQVLQALEERGVRPALRHAANSGAILDLPEARFDLVRPGIALYGYHPAGPGGDARGLRPALSLHSRLARVESVPPGAGVSYNHTFHAARRTTLGLVPLGYADGLPRALSNRGRMLVRGKPCPIVGRVCMDQTVIDVTDVPGAAVGAEVVIIGRQGDQSISAEDIAALAGTNSYEILCGIGPRVPRDYVDVTP